MEDLEGNGRGQIHVLSPVYPKSTVQPRKIVGVRADVVRYFTRLDRLSQLAGTSSQDTREQTHCPTQLACAAATVKTGSGAHLALPGIGRPRRDVNCSPSSTPEAKNEWKYVLLPFQAFMVLIGTVHW